MVHDLLAPMLEKMNSERNRLATFNERANWIEERINTLEHINGVHEKKPKVFEDIYNRFAETKEYIANNEARFDQRIGEV
jgi:hypothetical protein